jgi:hypothetical protein
MSDNNEIEHDGKRVEVSAFKGGLVWLEVYNYGDSAFLTLPTDKARALAAIILRQCEELEQTTKL